MPENHAQPLPVVLLELTNYAGNRGARWTLEVAEFFQRDRRVWVAANVQRLGLVLTGRRCGHAANRTRALLRAVEYRTGASREHCNRGHDYERKITLHGKDQRIFKDIANIGN
jgi:hypothetical protein